MLREGESIFGRTVDGVPSPQVYAPPPVRPMIWMTRELQGGDGAPAVPPIPDPALWTLAATGALGGPQALGGCACGSIRRVGGGAGMSGPDGLGGPLAAAAGTVGFVGGAFYGAIAGALVGALVGYVRRPPTVGTSTAWGAGIGALALGTIYGVVAGTMGAAAENAAAAMPQPRPGPVVGGVRTPYSPNGAPT